MKNCVFKPNVNTIEWLKAAGVRAVKTMAQTALQPPATFPALLASALLSASPVVLPVTTLPPLMAPAQLSVSQVSGVIKHFVSQSYFIEQSS